MGDFAMLFGVDDFSYDDSEGFEDDEEVWTVNEEWLIADASYVRTEHLRVIEDLGTHMGNLEYGHGQLVKKVI
nr:hypothetical protein [Tanacetum cinerariifolium]GFC40919.1 hypothetical protein [Tanacetum cinerariifolium]